MSRSHREFDEEEDDDLVDGPVRRDREFSLGTTTLLGIFFAEALLLAIVFAFGYSMGASHHTEPAAAATDPSSSSPDFNSFKKPAPGSLLSQPPTANASSTTIVKPESSSSSRQAYNPDANIATSVKPSGAQQGSQASSQFSTQSSVPAAPTAIPAPPPAAPKPATQTATQAAPTAPASVMVQIAAVTHQEDADLLVSTLKRRGYAVAIHSSPQDNLLHVQVGPFAQRSAAEAMRQKLLADGFNAILK